MNPNLMLPGPAAFWGSTLISMSLEPYRNRSGWVTLFASYISPGLFGAGFEDVTAMSHEILESFNDPFLNNATPVWQFPGQPANSTVCRGNLETGDLLEVLPKATVASTLTKGTKTTTYHPQTEALFAVVRDGLHFESCGWRVQLSRRNGTYRVGGALSASEAAKCSYKLKTPEISLRRLFFRDSSY